MASLSELDLVLRVSHFRRKIMNFGCELCIQVNRTALSHYIIGDFVKLSRIVDRPK